MTPAQKQAVIDAGERCKAKWATDAVSAPLTVEGDIIRRNAATKVQMLDELVREFSLIVRTT